VSSASKLQRQHYVRTAAQYDALHVSDADEHGIALRYLSALVREFDMLSVLDVGTGTGRAMAYLRRTLPRLTVVGVEPVLRLLQQAQAKPHLRGAMLASASGYRLPFPDASFDAVCQFGVLHHVEQPNDVVREMIRVATRAVFLSDSNRFGQGRIPIRWIKLLIAACGLWPVANFIKTHGTGYTISEGDGLSYSYSVFDSVETLRGWADRLILVPTSSVPDGPWHFPLLTASHVLLCAIRDRQYTSFATDDRTGIGGTT